jgi:hypothetical protein
VATADGNNKGENGENSVGKKTHWIENLLQKLTQA